MWKYIKRYLPYAVLAALFMVGEVVDGSGPTGDHAPHCGRGDAGAGDRGRGRLAADRNAGVSEDVAAIYPSQARLKSGRLPNAPLEIALSEDVLHYLGFTGNLGDTIPLSLSKALRHGIEISSYDFTANFVLVGITESNYLNYTSGGVTGTVDVGTEQELLPDNYLYYNLDIKYIPGNRKRFSFIIGHP